jgi:ubiquinone/menaquinone biosynthesis C-methylase UbiE
MPGIAFDRATGYYDSTRGYPAGVAERIRDALVAHTGAGRGSRFLELGIGTGRIALPFLQAGDYYAGMDLSRPMMRELSRKAGAVPGQASLPPRLAQADIARLPLAGDSFDVIVVVAVLHLVDGWQAALAEARRVLRKPGGWLLLGRDDMVGNAEGSTVRQVTDQWNTILRSLGIERDDQRSEPSGPLLERDDTVLWSYLDGLGGHPQTLTLLEYPASPLSPRAIARRHVERMYSSDWRLPDAVHAEAARRLLIWLDHECPNPDAEMGATFAFRATVARW